MTPNEFDRLPWEPDREDDEVVIWEVCPTCEIQGVIIKQKVICPTCKTILQNCCGD